jgi:hypothetical protein
MRYPPPCQLAHAWIYRAELVCVLILVRVLVLACILITGAPPARDFLANERCIRSAKLMSEPQALCWSCDFSFNGEANDVPPMDLEKTRPNARLAFSCNMRRNYFFQYHPESISDKTNARFLGNE